MLACTSFISFIWFGIASASYCPLNDGTSNGVSDGPEIVPVSSNGGGTGYSTYFDGFGVPYGGCGVPQSWLVDSNGKSLPFVALNTQLSSFSVPAHEEPIPEALIGMFNNGKNCGRWMKITLKDTCKRGSNTNERVCIVGNSDGAKNYESDSYSGKVVFGYVADKCSDVNVWCRIDKYHIDLSSKSISQYVNSWGNRLVTWEFIDSPPKEYNFNNEISYGWALDAYLPYFAAIIIYNTDNGISRVNVQSKSGTMIPARTNGILGQMWILPWESQIIESSVVVEAFDFSGASYGKWSVNFPCGAKCAVPTKADARKLV